MIHRALILTRYLLFALPFVALSGGVVFAEAREAQVEVNAERVELDRDQGRVTFIGTVVLRHAELQLRCDQLTARLGEEGDLRSIQAEGSVSVTSHGLHATAGAATYEPGAGRLILRGQPTVRSSSGTLRGRQITVDIRTGRVSIEEAHGVFRLN